MGPDPITLIANIGGSLTSSITLARFVFEVKNAEGDVKTCLSLVQTVERSLEHLINLRNKHLDYLSINPLALQRVDAIIASTTEGILDVGRLLEGCRAEAYEGSIPLNQKMKWALGNSSAFSVRARNLTEQHAAVNAEISYLRQIEIMQPLRVLVENTTFENLDVMCRKKKRRPRGVVGVQRASSGLDSTNLGAESNSEDPPPYEAHLWRSQSMNDLPPQDAGITETSSEVTNPHALQEHPLLEQDSLSRTTTHGVGGDEGGAQAQANEDNTDMERDEDHEVAWYREMKRREEAKRRRRALDGASYTTL